MKEIHIKLKPADEEEIYDPFEPEPITLSTVEEELIRDIGITSEIRTIGDRFSILLQKGCNYF